MNKDDLQPLLQHLVELRRRLIWVSLVLFIVTGVLVVGWAQEIYHFVALPMLKALPQGGQMIATDVASPFFAPIKVTLMVGFLVTLPFTLYQAWAFVAPGLYQNEKRLILPLLVSSMLLFGIGMCFTYYAVFPILFEMMAKFTPEGVTMMTDIDKYLSFVLGMFLVFGLAFETPVVIIILVRMGIVSVEKLREIRSYVVVGAFVVAAVVTPPDIASQVALAVLLLLLYELGILIAAWMVKVQPAAPSE